MVFRRQSITNLTGTAGLLGVSLGTGDAGETLSPSFLVAWPERGYFVFKTNVRYW